MVHLLKRIRQFLASEHGQDLIEYGLLAALIAIVVMVGVSSVGQTVYNVFWRDIGQAV